MSRKVACWTCIAALTALSMAGCGGTHEGLVPVSGTVTIDGQPLTQGQVMVAPDGKRASIGPLDENGRFELSCYQVGDGVAVGKHAVAVTAVEQLTERSNRWLAPKDYSHPAMSDLWVSIDGPTDDLKIELTWDKSKQHKGPYVEKF